MLLWKKRAGPIQLLIACYRQPPWQAHFTVFSELTQLYTFICRLVNLYGKL